MLRNRSESVPGRFWGYLKVGFVIGVALLVAAIAVDFALSTISVSMSGVSLAGLALNFGAFAASTLDVIALTLGAVIIHLLVSGFVIVVIYEYGQEAGWW